MVLETKRLLLRPWKVEDAIQLYEIAKDPRIGPITGWPIHTSIKNSQQIIKNVLSGKETYAVVLKENNVVAGSIGLQFGDKSNLDIKENEAEIGYWIGVPYWGKGLIPEATNALIGYGFDKLNLEIIWCAYLEGNKNSKRVQEKCGFIYHHTENKKWPIIGDVRKIKVYHMTKAHWHDLCKKIV